MTANIVLTSMHVHGEAKKRCSVMAYDNITKREIKLYIWSGKDGICVFFKDQSCVMFKI